MTNHSNRLSQAHTDLEQVLTTITRGTTDRPRHIRRIDLADEHLDQWADIINRTSSTGPERGGTSSPRETEDRAEARALATRIRTDTDRFTELVKKIRIDCHELYLLVLRYTEPVDSSKLPADTTVPGCISCARTRGTGATKIGGHFAPIRETAAAHALCDWCYRHALADANERGLPRGTLGDPPPIKAVDLYHRAGAQAAGKWLAVHRREPANA